MLGKTHKYVGGCCGILATQQLLQPELTSENFLLSTMLISGSLIGSLILDIDKQNTTYGKKFPILSTIINKLCGHRGVSHSPLVNVFILGILFALTLMMSPTIKLFTLFIYGGYTIYKLSHYILKKFIDKKLSIFISFIISLGFLYYLYNLEEIYLTLSLNYVLIGLSIGIISHIFLDYFNRMGVPLFYPLTSRKFRLFGISEKYGKVFSFIFTILVIGSTVMWSGIL